MFEKIKKKKTRFTLVLNEDKEEEVHGDPLEQQLPPTTTTTDDYDDDNNSNSLEMVITTTSSSTKGQNIQQKQKPSIMTPTTLDVENVHNNDGDGLMRHIMTLNDIVDDDDFKDENYNDNNNIILDQFHDDEC